jgi:hypothetical protein
LCSRGFLKSLTDAPGDRFDTFASHLLTESCQILCLFAEYLELLSGVRCPELQKLGGRLGGRELVSKIEGGFGVRASHVDVLKIIFPHLFDRSRTALFKRRAICPAAAVPFSMVSLAIFLPLSSSLINFLQLVD